MHLCERPHQVSDVDDFGDLAAWRRLLLADLDRVVNGDGNTRLLLVEGAPGDGVAGRD